MNASEERNEPVIGILEWFHLGEKEHVKKVIRQVSEIGITELRTGISWADYHTPEGRTWLEWLIPTLSEHVQILPCLLYTPPSIGISPKTSSPPRHPEYFADFTDEILNKYGEYFEWVELWNEPNNTSEYDFRLDPDWKIFNKFIGGAARVARKHGKKVVLGGMSPIDPNWLEYMYELGLMNAIDSLGIHGFPGTFDTDWPGWKTVLQQVQDVIDKSGGHQSIWITEVGYSNWQKDEKQQVVEFMNILKIPAERVYWYCLNDLDAKKATVNGYHVDVREYHFGMVDNAGKEKLLYRLLKDYGITQLDRFPWISKPYITIPEKQKSILITGGAGFIGTNLANRLLSEGKYVTILDNLSRPNVEVNLEWLRRTHGRNLNIEIADVRNRHKVQQAVDKADFVYHFAAQVTVTMSYANPYDDFSTNVMGTMNILEAIRNSSHRPPIVFTSTNKVYGNLNSYNHSSNSQRYLLKQKEINEDQKLDFHSPYGCSKGAADAYILDYARTFNLKAVVFRMSCIYGPHQFGTEDQGWVAHFLIQALKEKPICIFGDGKQVRDILFIDDLVYAFKLVYNNIDKVSGENFNIGGGFSNSISLKEFLLLIEDITGEKTNLEYSNWRSGDQKYYVSDTTKFVSMTGWKPEHDIHSGVNQLYKWLIAAEIIDIPAKSVSA